jgi:hypothetical protein
MEFFDVAWWILCAAVTLWMIQIKRPYDRFRIRISVVLFAVALFPAAYALAYPGAGVVAYMALLSPIFLFAGAFALQREQRDKRREEEPTETDSSQPSLSEPVAQPVADDRHTPKEFFVWGSMVLVPAVYALVSTLIGCPDGRTFSADVNGMSCFNALPLGTFFGTIGALGGIALIIVGILRLRADKR